MKLLWCWRCKIKVPMLNDDELKKAKELYSLGFRNTKKSREERFKPLLDYYNYITGFNETEPHAVMHHYISLYGPPCENCGKPYRTPQASFCVACGHKRV